jgi:hypothetical protein
MGPEVRIAASLVGEAPHLRLRLVSASVFPLKSKKPRAERDWDWSDVAQAKERFRDLNGGDPWLRQPILDFPVFKPIAIPAKVRQDIKDQRERGRRGARQLKGAAQRRSQCVFGQLQACSVETDQTQRPWLSI